MSMDEEGLDILDILRYMLDTDRSFHSTIRFLESGTRNHLVAAHMRNSAGILQLLRTYMSQPAPRVVVTMDLSGNFLDPVPITPSAVQIDRATETSVDVTNTNCAICYEPVHSATRIRHCQHSFHSGCIQQWFSMSPACPVCRYDIRTASDTTTNDRGVHSNQE